MMLCAIRINLQEFPLVERTRRQTVFWVGLLALCVGLFIAHRTPQQRDNYDRQSMNALVKQSWMLTASDPDAELVTGSLSAKPHRSEMQKYYVSFGNFDSIEMATKRYLDVMGRNPGIGSNANISIETEQTPEGVHHQVRTGSFDSAWLALSSCLQAGLDRAECKVLKAH
jgi:hypothetical protein